MGGRFESEWVDGFRWNAHPEYLQLCGEFDAVEDVLFIDTLRELTATELASLRESDPDEYDRLRERGRRAVCHPEDVCGGVRDIVVCNK